MRPHQRAQPIHPPAPGAPSIFLPARSRCPWPLSVGCPLDPYTIDPNLCAYQDVQKFKLQVRELDPSSIHYTSSMLSHLGFCRRRRRLCRPASFPVSPPPPPPPLGCYLAACRLLLCVAELPVVLLALITSDCAPSLAGNIMLTADRALVGSAIPGTRVTVTGVYSVYQPGGRGASTSVSSGNAPAFLFSRHSFAALRSLKTSRCTPQLSQPYLRVVGVNVDADGRRQQQPEFSKSEEENFIAMSRDRHLYDKIGQVIPGGGAIGAEREPRGRRGGSHTPHTPVEESSCALKFASEGRLLICRLCAEHRARDLRAPGY